MKQRWVEWYRYLHTLDFFKLHDPTQVGQETGNLFASHIPPANVLKNIFCDKLDYLSEDSDADRDHKYNILDESDVIEEEDEEEGANEEGDDEGSYSYNAKIMKMDAA